MQARFPSQATYRVPALDYKLHLNSITAKLVSAPEADSRGIFGGLETPLQKYIKEAKIMIYWLGMGN